MFVFVLGKQLQNGNTRPILFSEALCVMIVKHCLEQNKDGLTDEQSVNLQSPLSVGD